MGGRTLVRRSEGETPRRQSPGSPGIVPREKRGTMRRGKASGASRASNEASFGAARKIALPKCRVNPGAGDWIEVRQGTGLTLVRNECFTSPSGYKKTYANYTIYDGLREYGRQNAASSPEVSGNQQLHESGPPFLPTDVSFQASGMSLEAAWPNTHQKIEHVPRNTKRPDTSSPSRPRTAERPGMGMNGGYGQRASMRPDFQTATAKPRPKSSLGYNSRDRDDALPKRPQTSMGTRSQDGIPARTPLRPVTPAGWAEKKRDEQNFLKFVAAGDPPSTDRPQIQIMKGADSKETQSIDIHKTEGVQDAAEDKCAARKPDVSKREGRKARWQEIIDLRKGNRIRTTPGVTEPTIIVRPQFRRRRIHEYHAPPAMHTEAAQRLKHIKDAPAGKRFWVEKRDKTQFGADVGLGMATKLRNLRSQAFVSVNEQYELIKALLHAEGRVQSANRNADEWISGINSLMDKRIQLRALQNALSEAQANYKETVFEKRKAQNMLKTAMDKNGTEAEKTQLSQRIQEFSKREKELEVEVMEKSTLCDLFTVSVQELESLQPANKNHAGDVAEWEKINEQLQQGIFKDEHAEALCWNQAQDFLIKSQKGWWEEYAQVNNPFDVCSDKMQALASKTTSSAPTTSVHGEEATLINHEQDSILSEAALMRRKVKARYNILKKQEQWDRKDQEIPLWERSCDYEEDRLKDLIDCRSLYSENVPLPDIEAFTQEIRIDEQKRMSLRRSEPANELWPVLDSMPAAMKKKKRRVDTTDEEELDDSAEAVREEQLDAEHHTESAEATQLEAEEDKDRTGNEEVQLEKDEVATEGGSEDSSSEEEESLQDMANMQEATPGVAYTMIRKLKYPHESATMESWHEMVSTNDERKKALVDAYKSMCGMLKATPVGLHSIKEFIFSKKADRLSVAGCNWGVSQVTAFAGIMKGMDLTATGDSEPLIPVMSLRAHLDYQMLQHLDCSNNSLNGAGADQLCDCLIESNVLLRSLDISCNNLGEHGAQAIIELMSIKDSLLEELVANENHFGDRGSAAIVQVLPCLKSIRRLCLNKNKIGRKCCHELKTMLSSNQSLQELDLSWNEIRGQAAADFAEGLSENTTLARLNVRWNAFGDPRPMRKLADALLHCKITHLDLSANRIGPPGCALLADGLEQNTDLLDIILDENALMMQGIREVLRTSSETAPRIFSVNKCSFARNPTTPYDPAEPGGAYSLDLTDPYSHRILKNLVRYQLANLGTFDKATPCVLKSSLDDEEGKNCKTDFASEDDAAFPEAGIIQFNFLDKQRTRPADCKLNPLSLQLLVSLMSKEGMSISDKSDCMQTIIGDGFLSLEQLKETLKQISAYQTADRVNLFCQCFHRLADVEDSKTAFNLLTKAERGMAEKQLGASSLAFCRNNPTGHHHLDLSSAPQRDLALHLIQLRNEMEDLELAYYKYYDNRGGGKRDISQIGVVWRNSRWKTQPLTMHQAWQVPYCGILEVDFVDIRKPPEDAEPLSEEDFQDLILSLWDQKSELLGLNVISHHSMVKIMREVSNTKFFACKQVARMIGRFDPSKDSKTRVEIAIGCWTRTIDYHGLNNVLNLMTPTEQAAVIHRLGPLQTFDEMMAVGFYELNLESPGDRFMFQELVHLGAKEPGESMRQFMIDQKESEPRTEWLAGGIPEQGIVSFFFVRTQGCLEKVFEKGAYDHSKREPTESSKSDFMETYLKEFCKEGFCSPDGEEWIKPYTYRRVRRKLGIKFDTPEHAFYALDDDDSGYVTRQEMGAGLQSVGIYMNPQELQEFVNQLDIDGGGRIEIDEIVDFWYKYETEIFF